MLPRVWYKVADGQRTLVEVLTVDTSHPPASYAIRMPGTEVVRETEAGRLEAMSAEEKLEHSAQLQPPAGASLLVYQHATHEYVVGQRHDMLVGWRGCSSLLTAYRTSSAAWSWTCSCHDVGPARGSNQLRAGQKPSASACCTARVLG